MKKLLASLLAMVMALSLAGPAFADDTPPLISPAPGEYPPVGWTADKEREELARQLGFSATSEYWTMDDDTWEWIAAHQEETKEFLANIDGYVRENYGSDSLADFAADFMGCTPEGATLYLLEYWVWDQQDAERYTSFRAEHPDLVAQFEANACDYFTQEYSYWDSAEEYMEYYDLTEAEFITAMVNRQIDSYLGEQQRLKDLEDFEASHPGMIARFEANAYDYFAKRYYYYGSAEDYMTTWDLTEEEFIQEMVQHQIDDQLAREARQLWIDLQKAEMGGVPGQTGVMIDGEYVQFPDAAPEVAKGRTMAPLRAVMEALGAEVDYHGNDDIRCTVDGFQYTFAVGSSTVTVTPAAGSDADVPKPEDIVMDCAPYIKNGRTYVPVRFFAEALGYTVEWDGEFQTAVLTDMDALVADIDRNFTVANKVFAAQKQETEGSRRIGYDCNASLTIFNTLDGDATGSMTFSADLIASPAGSSGTVKYDMASLLDAILRESGAKLASDEYTEMMEFIKPLLSGSAEVRKDAETGMLYLSMPGLAVLGELMGFDLPEDAWFSMDLSGLTDSMSSLTGGMSVSGLTEYGTMGSLILTCAELNAGNPVYVHSYALNAAETAAVVIGDEQFARRGDAMVLSLDTEDLMYLIIKLSDYGTLEYEDMPREFSIDLAIHDNGTVDLGYVLRSSSGSYYSPDMRITFKGSYGAEKTSVAVEYHIKNQMKLLVTVEQAAAPTSQQPQTTPPEDAEVIPLDGMYDSPVYPDYDGLLPMAGNAA